jgi:hypothetical protein
MRTRALAATAAIIILVVGCGDESSVSTTSTSVSSTAAPTSTSTATTTSSTVAAATTSPSSTQPATTAPPATSAPDTTIPAPGEPLTLTADGLGSALFGADAAGVIRYVTSFLDAPTSDTGWVDPIGIGACPGTEARIVSWGDLALFFSDESTVAQGFRHFNSYRYGPPFGARIDPYGLRTEGGVRVGDPVAIFVATYPEANIVEPQDEGFAPTFEIEEGLTGSFTSTGEGGVVQEFIGGFGCGE